MYLLFGHSINKIKQFIIVENCTINYIFKNIDLFSPFYIFLIVTYKY